MINDPSVAEPSLWDEARLVMVARPPENRRLYAEWMERLMKSSQVSLEDLKCVTKIPDSHLRSLLAGEFHQLPYEAMARGFTENIAKVLSPDPAPVLAAYRACYPKNDSRTLSLGIQRQQFLSSFLPSLPAIRLLWKKKRSFHRKLLFFAVAALLALGVSMGLWYVLPSALISTSPSTAFAPPVGAAHMPTPLLASQQGIAAGQTSTSDAAGLSPSPALQTLEVAAIAPTLIVRSIDDEPAQELSLKPGSTYTFTFLQSAEISTQHVELLQVKFNGEDLGKLTSNFVSNTLRFSHRSEASSSVDVEGAHADFE